jgi:hypothetical protein
VAEVDALLAVRVLHHALEDVVLALQHGLHVDVLDEEIAMLVQLVLQLVPAALARQRLEPGLEKTRVFKKKPAQWFFLGFWVFLVFWGFFGGFFWVFLGYFVCFFAQGFFSFKNTLRCIQTLTYNHSY